MIRLIIKVGDDSLYEDRIVTGFRVFEVRSRPLESLLSESDQKLRLMGMEVVDDLDDNDDWRGWSGSDTKPVPGGFTEAPVPNLPEVAKIIERLQREGMMVRDADAKKPAPPTTLQPIGTAPASQSPDAAALAALKERLLAKRANQEQSPRRSWLNIATFGLWGDNGKVKALPLP